MTSKKYIKIILVIACLLFSWQVSLAQQAPDSQDYQQTDNGNAENTVQTDNNENSSASESQQPTQNNNYQSQSQATRQGNNTSTNNVQAPSNNNQPKSFFNFQNSQPNKPDAQATDQAKPAIDNLIQPNLMKKKFFNMDFSTLMAILGLFGTFLGLFSTWIIYHLNKKNNDPLIIDKRDSALKYIEDLYKIKNYLDINKISKLEILLSEASINNLESSKAIELAKLLSFYGKMISKVANVDLMTINNRFQKHMHEDIESIFKSLIAQYSLIIADYGVFNKNLPLKELYREISLDKMRNKIISIYSFEKKITMAIDVLKRELKD